MLEQLNQSCLFSLQGLVNALTQLHSRLHVDASVKPAGELGEGDVQSASIFNMQLDLEIPSILCRPTLPDLQTGLNKAINMSLRIADEIHPWAHVKECQAAFKASESEVYL